MHCSASGGEAGAGRRNLAHLPPRERILGAARELFYRLGIRAVGVDAIAEAAGTNKMTLYRHFTSKDDLVAACLVQIAQEDESRWQALAAANPGDAKGHLLGWLTALQRAYSRRRTSGGAPSPMPRVELPPDKDHPARRIIETHKIARRDSIIELCRAGGFAEPWRLADEIFLLIEGANVCLQSMGPNGPAARMVVAMAEALVADHEQRDAHCASRPALTQRPLLAGRAATMSWQPASPPASDLDSRSPPAHRLLRHRAARAPTSAASRCHGALCPRAQRQMVGPFIFWDPDGAGDAAGRQRASTMRRPHPPQHRPAPPSPICSTARSCTAICNTGSVQADPARAPSELEDDGPGAVSPIPSARLAWRSPARRGSAPVRHPIPDRRCRGAAGGRCAWSFVHHAASNALPRRLDGDGRSLLLIAGSLFGAISPVATPTPMIYADVALESGARLPIPVEHEERGLYLVAGTITLGRDSFAAGQMLVLQPGAEITVRASDGPARLMLIGGEPMDGPRHIWWNFVASSRERIEQAKEDWKQGRFPPVPGEHEFIPLLRIGE